MVHGLPVYNVPGGGGGGGGGEGRDAIFCMNRCTSARAASL